MKRQCGKNISNRVIMGIISIFLWVVVLTMFLIAALDKMKLISVIKPTVAAILLVTIIWLFYNMSKARRFEKRFNDAMANFMIKRDVKSYFAELDALEIMNNDRPIGSMYAKEYFDYQRIFALKNSGRKDEAYILLEKTLNEAKSDRAVLLLKAEKEYWD